MNKSLATNLVTVVVIALGYVVPAYNKQVLSTGFFALSGAVTNWLAVYMLFEKVPGLYGSGVIPLKFNEFKAGIKNLMMTQFFTDENIDRFFQGKENSTVSHMHFDHVIDALDYNRIFDGLIEVVQESPLGGMLGMVGGNQALEPMRAPFEQKMKTVVLEITKTESFLNALEENILPSHISSEVTDKIEEIVDGRLEELTPEMVKDIIQEMIRTHLGWLVVWGGVFGGLIGLVMSFIHT